MSPMDEALRLCFLASFFQVVLLTCEKALNPVEVELIFPPFKGPGAGTVTCRTASDRQVYVEPVDQSACSPDCQVSLQLVEDPAGYSITLTGDGGETKTFHFIPVSPSSVRVRSTTTTVVLSWELPGQRSLTALSLHDARTRAVTRVVATGPSGVRSPYEAGGLRPGTRFGVKAEVTAFLKDLNVTVKQRLYAGGQTARCPRSWLASGRSCYSVGRSGLTWGAAQRRCLHLAAGGHLADLKTPDELLFVSSRILRGSNLLLLWTGLSDQQEEGRPLWTDGSAHNLTDAVMSSLPANETDCFALQRNATGPGYFLSPFFCNIALPFICQYRTPPLPPSFSFGPVQVAEQQVELRWSDLSASNLLNISSFEIFLQYREEANGELFQGEGVGMRPADEEESRSVEVPVSLSSRGVTVAGLSPGRVYSFTLRAAHSGGSSWTLGETWTAYTRPPSPQNVTVASITTDQIRVRWTLPDSRNVGWMFLVRCMDTSTGQERLVRTADVSRTSEGGPLRSHAAGIGGLESHRKYRIEVSTVTQRGIESCERAAVTAQTELEAPGGLVVSSTGGNLTVCWAAPLRHPPDGYHVTSRPPIYPSSTTLWLNQSGPGARWFNQSMCFDMGGATPGRTYEVGVVSLKGSDRSKPSSVTYTTGPLAVRAALPLSVGTNSAQLLVLRPQLSVMDGVKVCACPGACGETREGSAGDACGWHPLPAGAHVLTVQHLRPGSEYQLGLYSTSHGQAGPPYYSQLIRTGLAPPDRVREGVVTDTSIELLWDPARGEAHGYEVACLNCEQPHRVQKVPTQNSVFSGLTPGRRYHFAVRTEKETFADSSPVSINITAAPSSVEVSLLNKTTSSLSVAWSLIGGVVSGFHLSITNATSTQEQIVSQEAPRSYCFEGLAPGSQYTIKVISISGEKRSKPSQMILHTLPEMPQEVALSGQAVTSAFVSWRPPPGGVKGYKLVFGPRSAERRAERLVQGTTYEILDLVPGSDYRVSVQSVLGSDASRPVHREFSTLPVGMCPLRLADVTPSSFSVTWDGADGGFDFHRVTVANSSATSALVIPKEERVAVVTGLAEGCAYNVTVERVRGAAAGSGASLRVSTAPADVRGMRTLGVSARAFSLRWEQAGGCVDRYLVNLQPNNGKVTVHPARDGRIQADVVNVSPGTQYTVTVAAASASSSNIGPGVSRMINTNESAPGPPSGLEGEAVGSNGILLSWTTPPDSINIDGYVIRYKEVCPYPDSSFTEVTKYLDIPETLLTDFTPGSTYHIEVAAISSAGVGAFSKSLYIKTAESAPGLVTNLTAFAQNHSFVVVTWFLPRRINGLITKFAVKAKHARTGQTVRTLEVNAEDIMTGALPHCNDAADILSRATLSPLEITASSPPVTLSAVPPAASWSVPISVGVDQLRPYTAYLFEVSAFTSDGEGQIASTMVRMPESAPEDPPQNFEILNMTSRSISVSWTSPNIITGKFSYVLYFYGPAGYLYENSTGDMQFTFAGLNPYTRYSLEVRAKAAGEVGPAVQAEVVTPAEAPGAVQDLRAEAEDSVSIHVSWRSPAQPNGLITRYRLQVLVDELLLQDITLTADLNTTGLKEDETIPAGGQSRRKRSAHLSLVTSPLAFTAALGDHTSSGSATASPPAASSRQPAATDSPPVLNSTASRLPEPGASHSPASLSTNPQSADSASSGTAVFSPTSAAPTPLPPWLTRRPQPGGEPSRPTGFALTSGQLRSSTRGASATAQFLTRGVAVSGSTVGGVTVKEEVLEALPETLSYLVSDLNPFTEYTFRVTASTAVGEGPATDTTEKTREQVPSSVLDVSYQNISSTSILVSWAPPLSPNGRITHYTVYGLRLQSNQALKWITNSTSILITDLDKYTGYKLRVAASTAVGESSLSEEDDVFAFTLEDEPDSPPEDLAVEDISPSTATLTWSPPERANGVIQHYEVLYENESFSAVANASSNRVTLTDLRPFSYYNVSVRVYTRHGHGNQTSDTLYLLTGEDVPGSPPYGLSYESLSPSEVNVTWEPPLFPNGIVTSYSLELWNSTHYLNLTSPTISIHITHLRKYAHYRVTVQAHTRAGPGNFSSEPLNITTLEDAPDTPPQFLHARKLSDDEVELSWQPPLQANSDILYYFVRVWNESAELLRNVTGTSVVINVDPESLYNASVSSWTRLGDGGALTYISFTTAHAGPFDPPQNVSVANVTASSVTLSWRPPAEPNGIIVHYTVYYSDSNSLAEKRVSVAELATLPSPDSAYTHTVSGLTGGTNYTVWMTSSTAEGDGGIHSQPQTVFLPEYVPSDSVRNLTAQIFSSTAIIVSWDPPLEPNGRPYYLLTLQEAGVPPNLSNQGAPAVNKTIRHTTTDNVFLFTKLRKYFPYVLTVTPATGAGPAYNHTRIMYLRSDDDIPSSAPLLVSTRNLTSSSIEVVWQRPLEANGEITEFLLTLFGPAGSNTTHTPTNSAVLANLLPYTAYNLSITAATRKGSGPHLLLHLHTDEGVPVSPPRNLTIYNHSAVSVWLSWEPPLEPNGVVIQYGFRIQNLITHTVTHRNSSGPSTTEYLSGFRPHSSYEISAYAYTRVGRGSQFSSPVTFTTNESVSDAVGNLTCSGVSWDSIQLSWELPDHPNGQIRFYEVQLEAWGRSHVHSADGAEYTVSGLSPNQEYTLTVAAVNSAGPGDPANCTASTLSESVPAAPRSLTVADVDADGVTLLWAAPLSVPGVLREFRVVAQLLAAACEPDGRPHDDGLSPGCVESEVASSVNASGDAGANHTVTLRPLAKYRYYRFRVAAVTNAGVGEHTRWSYARTLAGNPDGPPRGLNVTASSNGLRIAWEAPAILSGPTSYLVQVDGPNLSISAVRAPGELRTIVVTNLTAFTRYFVTVTAFTGPLEHAARDGKAIGPEEYQTLEEQPKDPPKNVVISIIPEEVTRLKVTFTPPEEPNGNITAYFVYVFEKDQLVKNVSLNVTERGHNTITGVIEGLKGGHSYSIQISAKNGAGRSPPSPRVQIMTDIKAPAEPTQRPQAVLSHGGVAMVTHRSITIRMPACFYSDDNGPIKKIQVIVAESGVKDIQNVTNWRSAFFDRPAPYLADQGFPNPPCPSGGASSRLRGAAGRSSPDERSAAGTYVIGEDDGCLRENSSGLLCNGPLKPNTVYVFRFRATNVRGQTTDSQYSEHVKTAVDGLLTREEQIILGVLLSFFLAVLLIIIICGSVKIHQRKKEGGTYSPREAEIIETKYKLDQLIAVADLELKQEKINRYSSFFFRRKEIYVIQLLSYRKSLKPVNKKTFLQHVEDLCANDNAKFQEEFAELPKLLQDLGTTDADLPWNKSKNRFPNIKPYNNNRVKLLSEPGSAGSDYINASFVSGYLCPNEFIATQGPLPGTVADFWRMIWETGTRTIAMLTQCFEKGRIRCHKYWPEDNKPMSVFSDILVSKVSEEVFPDWTVRTLKVEKHGHYTLVRHFNYTSWPEHGVPESCSTFIKFVKAVRGHSHETSTIAVHCSAGVGRTGVFIALDHLVQHIRDHDFVDIYGLVAELRRERMCMVQNLAQYIFLHQSMMELLNSKGNSQSIWFVSYSSLEKMDSLDAMEGDVELEWEETTM